MPHPRTLLCVVPLLLVLTACGSAPGSIDPSGVDGLEIPTPSADPRDFVRAIDNPLLPLAPGSSWTYAATTEGVGSRTVTVTVSEETRLVEGVRATVVNQVVTDVRGKAVDDAEEWYAQDRDGNVWFFGTSTGWEAGVDGARAGMAMLATPRVGDGYLMGYAVGEAEDQAEVLSLDAARDVPFGSFSKLLETGVTSALEPGVEERRHYAVGVGLVQVQVVAGEGADLELVDHLPG